MDGWFGERFFGCVSAKARGAGETKMFYHKTKKQYRSVGVSLPQGVSFSLCMDRGRETYQKGWLLVLLFVCVLVRVLRVRFCFPYINVLCLVFFVVLGRSGAVDFFFRDN